MYPWLSPAESIKSGQQAAGALKRATGLSWSQHMYSFAGTRDAQGHDGERIMETGNGNHVWVVIQRYTAIAVFCCHFCLYGDFSSLLYHSA